MSGDTAFNAKDGIVANTVFTANSTLTQANNLNVAGVTNAATLNVSNSVTSVNVTTTGLTVSNSAGVTNQVTVGANVLINSSTFSVGNSTVNVSANSSTIAVGSSVAVNGSQIFQGNSTSNTVYTSSGLVVSNPLVSGTMNSSGVFLGNSTINASANSSAIAIGSNVVANQSQFFVGNSTQNGVHTQTAMFVSSATVNAVMTTAAFSIGNTTVNASMSQLAVAVGGNVTLNATSLKIGALVINATAMTSGSNLTVNTTALSVSDASGTFKANTTKIVLGSNVSVNTGAYFVGNAIYAVTVNSQGVYVGNNSGNATMNTATIQLNSSVGDVLTLTPTNVTVGANVSMSQTTLLVGDGVNNTQVTGTTVQLTNITSGNLTLNSSAVSVTDLPSNTTATVNTTQVVVGNSVGSGVLASDGSNSVIVLTRSGSQLIINTTSVSGTLGVYVQGLTTNTPKTNDVSNLVPTTEWVRLAAPSTVNVLRNALMEVCQRANSGTVADGTSAYTVDGWVLFGSGNSVQWQQLYNADVVRYELKINCRPGQTNTALTQRIASTPYSGRLLNSTGPARPVTVQFSVFNASGVTLQPQFTTYFPTATDNFTTLTQDLAPVTLQAVANGGTGTLAYTFTPNTSIANGMAIQLLFGNTLNQATGYVAVVSADIRLNPGAQTGLTSLQPTPDKPTYDKELLNCYQYYYTAPVALITRVASERPIASLTPPIEMYKTPTSTVATILSNSATWVGSNASCNLTSGCVLLTTNTVQSTVGSYAVVNVAISSEL